jgi:hypothetical protein
VNCERREGRQTGVGQSKRAQVLAVVADAVET